MFRSELKFLVDAWTVAALQPRIRAEMSPDPHAIERVGDDYQTKTLYFDTDEFDLYFRRGSNARAKFRIRRYNDAQNIFLERKARINQNRLYKRRSGVSLSDLARLYDHTASWDGNWFARRLQIRQLRPVCQVSYRRMARVAVIETESMRLTIDHGLRANVINSTAFRNDTGIELLAPGHAMLELKYGAQLPPPFTKIIEEFRLEPLALSKYRLAVKMLGLVLSDPLPPAAALALCKGERNFVPLAKGDGRSH